MKAVAKRRMQVGFTLVEVLVAMVVMAIMAVMAWQGVDSIVRARDASEARLEQTLRLNTVVAQWERDLASVQTTGKVDALKCDGASVRMTRRVRDGIQVVVWSLRPDPSGNALVRWAGPVATTGEALQDSWLASLQLQGTENGSVRALTGISTWQTPFWYKDTGMAHCQSSAGTGSKLIGVRLLLSFAGGNGVNGDLLRDVMVTP